MLAGIGVAAAVAADTAASGPILSLTATTENVTGAPDAIRIEVLRWSTDMERDQLTAAWNLTATPSRGGSGPGARARGSAGTESGPAPGGVNPAARAGRGGRGGERGGATEARPLTPERSLAAALGAAPTVGYLWSSEVAGYALRMAARIPETNGGERILLITERRLGAWNDLWKPTGSTAANGAAPDYEFSLVELHLNSKEEGEGKASLNGKIAVDSSTKMFALSNYDALPVVLKNVRRRAGEK
jgi:hypothetical protein